MKYFGTDGIRDRVDGPLLQESFVWRVGAALGRWLNARHQKGAAPHVVIGRDTRASGGRLLYVLTEGLHSEGIKVFDGGIVPTPGIALAVSDLDLDLGVVITASHNPASDNGIKLFAPGGVKLKDEDEQAIEDLIDAVPKRHLSSIVPPPIMLYDARRHYLERIRRDVTPNLLVGRRILLDTANGAASFTTPEVLAELGAQLICRGNDPSGHNINSEVGSEYVDLLAPRVRELPVDIAIAHDGDGDRVIFVDECGKVVDGDALMAVIACHWLQTKRLRNRTLVTTVMSNAGLETAVRNAGGQVQRSDVGDRNVFFKMVEGDFNFGGESSGHFILRDTLPTGDGLLAALEVLKIIVETGRPLSELRAVYQPAPQAKVNLKVSAKPALEEMPALQEDLEAFNAGLGVGARSLLRYSGTEPRVRLLVEALEKDTAERGLKDLTEIVRRHLPVI
ncbi:MAG: phosphoglucosamine mutase [Opitutales bacterium]|nr:phosphoglucosamine mutase [Opitutales bacterium]